MVVGLRLVLATGLGLNTPGLSAKKQCSGWRNHDARLREWSLRTGRGGQYLGV